MADIPAGLWPQFESLFLDHYVPDFWSIGNIELPYGHVMVIDPDDMPSMLWRGNLNKIASYDQVLSDLKDLEKQYQIPMGLCFSSSWKGDLAHFKEALTEKGFKRRTSFHWLVKNIQNFDTTCHSGFTVERTHDPNLMREMLTIGFDEATAKIFVSGALRNKDDKTRGHFIARNPETNDVIGCAAATYKDNLAYMSCLAVHPDYRRKGIAKDLVSARIKFLQDNDVNFITTAVNEKNDTSMKVQLNAGYAPLEVTEYWMKV